MQGESVLHHQPRICGVSHIRLYTHIKNDIQPTQSTIGRPDNLFRSIGVVALPGCLDRVVSGDIGAVRIVAVDRHRMEIGW